MKQQLPSIQDETAGIEDDEGEDLIQSINSLLNKGKYAAAIILRNKLKSWYI